MPPMLNSGKITGTDDRVESTWPLELDTIASPITELIFIPEETMLDMVPVNCPADRRTPA
jgi:hypothetical protein